MAFIIKLQNWLMKEGTYDHSLNMKEGTYDHSLNMKEGTYDHSLNMQERNVWPLPKHARKERMTTP